jgi:integrase
MWVWLYREGGSRKYITLGLFHKMTKAQAEKKRDEALDEVQCRQASAPNPDITFGQFLNGVVLPFYRSKWKRSTASTTESRIQHHLTGEFGEAKLQSLTLKGFQKFLHEKAKQFSRSIVAHLRWDLRAIFKLALAEGYIQRDPTAALYTPKEATVAEARVMTGEEVEKYIGALEVRERVIAHIAIFAGIRPGEILALQRRHVTDDCRQAVIEQRIYRGDVDTPKTLTSRRKVAIPPKTAGLLKGWMQAVGDEPTAWLFVSENPLKPMWKDNIWHREMKPLLKPLGLEWANFQVMRRTHASLGHDAGIDPKVSADQRGHGIGVALDVYTHASMGERHKAAEQLENAVLTA